MTDSGNLFVEATLHRAISDLTVVFQQRAAAYVLVAGDLNLYSYSDGTVWGDRAMTVLSPLHPASSRQQRRDTGFPIRRLGRTMERRMR